MLVKRDQRNFCQFSLFRLYVFRNQRRCHRREGGGGLGGGETEPRWRELLTAFTFPHKELAHLDLVGRICLKHKYGRLIFLLNPNKHVPIKHL